MPDVWTYWPSPNSDDTRNSVLTLLKECLVSRLICGIEYNCLPCRMVFTEVSA